MTKKSRLLLVASLLSNVVLIACCSGRIAARGRHEAGNLSSEFQVARTSNGVVVSYSKGHSFWTISSNMLSMNCGLEQSVTFLLAAGTDHVQKIVLELAPASGGACYVTDLNADGIPDQRQSKADWQRQVFYNGRFLPVHADARGQFIVYEGTTNDVIFDGSRWIARQRM